MTWGGERDKEEGQEYFNLFHFFKKSILLSFNLSSLFMVFFLKIIVWKILHWKHVF